MIADDGPSSAGSRRPVPSGRRPVAWLGGLATGAALLGVTGLAVTAPAAGGALEAQEPTRSESCRCVDRDGNEIENCTCIVPPDLDAFAQVWSVGLPNRARIGVTVSGDQDATSDQDGARVQEVLDGGPADEAGLREGDIIVRVNGRSLFEPLPEQDDEDRLDLEQSVPVQRLLAVLADVEPREEVEIEYLRDGETRRAVVEAERNPARFGQNFTFRSGEGPRILVRPGRDFEGLVMPREGRTLRYSFPEGATRFRYSFPEGATQFRSDSLRFQLDSLRAHQGDFHVLRSGRMDPCFRSGSGESGSVFVFGGNCVDGLELTTLGPELGAYFGTEEGVLVTDVREGTTLGLQPGDVLLAVDGREVQDVDHARRILGSYEPDEELTLRIVRHGETMEVTGRRR